jgi:hypothetical protein
MAMVLVGRNADATCRIDDEDADRPARKFLLAEIGEDWIDGKAWITKLRVDIDLNARTLSFEMR